MLQTGMKTVLTASAAAAALSLSLYAVGPAGAAGAAQGNGTMGGGMSGQGMMNGMKLQMPMMDPAKGRMLFASKGCVVCHSINGIGGEDAPKLDASTMQDKMDPFDFAAKMWHGAPAMIAMQEDELGHQIEFTGDELADIIAFAHSPSEQAKFSEADIPDSIKDVMEHEEDSDANDKADTAQHKD